MSDGLTWFKSSYSDSGGRQLRRSRHCLAQVQLQQLVRR